MKRKQKQNYSSGGPSLFSFNSIQGILFTISNYSDKESRREAAALFEQYASLDYDTFVAPTDSKEEKGDDATKDVSNFVDIAKEIQKEVSSLKKNQQTGFQLLDTHCKGYIFLRFLDRKENPVSMCQRIMKHFMEDPLNNLQSRYLNRMIPVQNTCHGTIENFKAMAQPLIKTFFEQYENAKLKYKVIIKRCNSNTLDNQEVITTICNFVPLRHFAAMKDFHVAILVTMIRNICMISICTEYNELLELNINAIKGNKQAPNKKSETKGEEEEEETTEEKMEDEPQQSPSRLKKKRRIIYKIHNLNDFNGIYLL